jgi:hypothetical protein
VAWILVSTPVALANLDLADVAPHAKGFSGLRAGYHHLWVRTETTGGRYQTEVVLKDDQSAVALKVDPRHGLVVDESPQGWSRVDDARARRLEGELCEPFAANQQHAYDWGTATWMIDRPVFQILLGEGPLSLRSGELREMQAAFVRMALRHDAAGRARFLELVRLFSEVPLAKMGSATDLLLDLAETLTAMLAIAPALFGADQAAAGEWILRLCGTLERAGRALHEPLIPAAAALYEAWNGGRT